MYTIELLFISPWKNGALRQSRPLILAPEFSKLFSRAASNNGILADELSKEKCSFLPQQDSLALASSYFFLDSTQMDCNKGDQIFDDLQYIEHLLTQKHQKRRQSCWAPPYEQLMMQQFLHQTIAHRSCVSLTVFLRSTTFSRHDQRSAITGPTSTPIALYG